MNMNRENRGRNTGFIRTDLRENSCRMELQIRGFDRFKEKMSGLSDSI